jgi:ABC-type transport system involved in cytochrome c biogenesis ATPase subunit
VQIFQGLDLDVANSELFCWLDPSGGGKTTLRRIMTGLEGLDGGKIWVGDREISALWRALSEIAVPLAHPAILAVGLLAFIFSWNESFFGNPGSRRSDNAALHSAEPDGRT